MSANSFEFDVFLSHSSKDKSVARPLAERLRKDGLRVWFDEWELKLGDSIPAKIEDGLERSRILLFCMSAQAFGADWATLESQTFRFRDPLNRERRFIPLRLDDAEPKDSLKQFAYIDWRDRGQDREYLRLLDACRLTVPGRAAEEKTEAKTVGKRATEMVTQLDSKSTICAYAFSMDGKRALSGSTDRAVRLWDVETGRCLRVLEGHAASVRSVAWSRDQRRALSGSEDMTIRLWDVETGRCLRVLGGYKR